MNTQVELSTDDVIESFCRMLEPGVKKHVLPQEDCNKYGIDVLYKKKDASMIMFHFITKDMLEVNLELDMMELAKRGKEYLDHLFGLLCDQTEKAREERQKANTIDIYNTGSYAAKADEKKRAEIFKPKPSTLAVNEVLH